MMPAPPCEHPFEAIRWKARRAAGSAVTLEGRCGRCGHDLTKTVLIVEESAGETDANNETKTETRGAPAG